MVNCSRYILRAKNQTNSRPKMYGLIGRKTGEKKRFSHQLELNRKPYVVEV